MKQAVCILLEKDGKVLGVSRKYDRTAFGLPGGSVELKESSEQAAIRELKEETGLDLYNPKPIFERVPDVNDDYNCVTFVGEVQGTIATEESGVVAWVTWDTLCSGPFADYNKKLYTHLYGAK